MKKLYLIIPLLALLAVSCQKEGLDEVISVTPVIQPPVDIIEGSIAGYVVDDQQRPIHDAIVKHNDDTTLTDSDGHFVINDIELFQDGSLLLVEKDGYIAGSKKFYASDENVLTVQLSNKAYHEEASSSTGGRVDINEAFVILPSGGYNYNDQSKYNGSIRVYGKWLNPTDEENSFEMPGDLTGYDNEKELKALICFSMLKIGLEDKGEEKIELPDGETALINFPIPEELRAYAEDEIPLWYFNVTLGTWIEDGVAILEQDSYIGEVSHIATWACGTSHPIVEISGFLESNGVSLGSKKLKLIDSQSGYMSYTTTNENGFFDMRIPSGSRIDIEIYHECSNSPLQKSFGTFSSNQNLDTIDIPSVGNSMVNIKGELHNCTDPGTVISNAYLKVEIGDSKYLINSQDGKFDSDFSTNCTDSEISIIAIDPVTKTASQELSKKIKEEINFGGIDICDSVQAGYSINYAHIDWADELADEVRHSWSTRTILSSNKKIIFNPRIVHQDNIDLIYLSGAFVVIEGSSEVNYLLRYESHGFSISGICEVNIEDHGLYKSYRFHNSLTQESTITDIDMYPGDVGMVDFDLVYYD